MIISGIDITIQKSKRKTVSIFVERDGTVSARVPDKLSDDEIVEIIQSKEYQIYKNLAEWTQLNEKRIDREYVSGQSFLYLGRNYRLKIVNKPLDKLIFKSGRFYLSNDKKENAKELFKDFYKDKLHDKLPPIINRYKNKLGVAPKEVKVMELRNRWASCTLKGNVNFHWKCAMAPIDVLNYIVVHELVHLIHPNHTTAFWNEVDKIMPNYEKHLHWLKINGAGMDL